MKKLVLTEYLEVRVSPKEKNAYWDAAQRQGLSLSVWVRMSLKAVMDNSKKPKP